MNPRKDQTEEQRIMREFAMLVHKRRRIGNPSSSLRATAKDVWRLNPGGYSSFHTYYTSLKALALIYGNGL